MYTTQQIETALLNKNIVIDEIFYRKSLITKVHGYAGKKFLKWDAEGKCFSANGTSVPEYDLERV